DAYGRVTAIQWSGPNGASVAGIAYTYDAAGNRTQEVDNRGSSTYGYDRLDRLVQASYPDAQPTSYTYDAAGNRLGMQVGSTYTFYSHDGANRLQSVGGDQVTWDGNGNMTGKG